MPCLALTTFTNTAQNVLYYNFSFLKMLLSRYIIVIRTQCGVYGNYINMEAWAVVPERSKGAAKGLRGL